MIFFFKNSIESWHEDKILLVICFIIRCFLYGGNCPCFKTRVWIMWQSGFKSLVFISKLITVRIWNFWKIHYFLDIKMSDSLKKIWKKLFIKKFFWRMFFFYKRYKGMKSTIEWADATSSFVYRQLLFSLCQID